MLSSCLSVFIVKGVLGVLTAHHHCRSKVQISYSDCTPQRRLCDAVSSRAYQQIELIVVIFHIIHHSVFVASPWKGVNQHGAVSCSPFWRKSDWQLARCTLTAEWVHSRRTGAERGCALGCTME